MYLLMASLLEMFLLHDFTPTDVLTYGFTLRDVLTAWLYSQKCSYCMTLLLEMYLLMALLLEMYLVHDFTLRDVLTGFTLRKILLLSKMC